MSAAAGNSPVSIDAALCDGCKRCVTICPTDVMRMDEATGKAWPAFARDCHVCFLCVEDCAPRAISLDPSVGNPRHRSVYHDLDESLLSLTPKSATRY